MLISGVRLFSKSTVLIRMMFLIIINSLIHYYKLLYILLPDIGDYKPVTAQKVDR